MCSDQTKSILTYISRPSLERANVAFIVSSFGFSQVDDER